MYKSAPYLTHQSSPYQLELLRICTQHTIHIIPSHLYHAYKNPRADYQDCVCPYCLPSCTQIRGDELHIVCQCPTTKAVLDRFAVKLKHLTRLMDLPHYLLSRRDHTISTWEPPCPSFAKWITEMDTRSHTPLWWVRVCSLHTHHIPTTSCCWHVL